MGPNESPIFRLRPIQPTGGSARTSAPGVAAIHLWIALVLCLPLVLGVTGSILVFREELGNLLAPRPRLSPATGKPHTVVEIIAAVQARIDFIGLGADGKGPASSTFWSIPSFSILLRGTMTPSGLPRRGRPAARELADGPHGPGACGFARRRHAGARDKQFTRRKDPPPAGPSLR